MLKFDPNDPYPLLPLGSYTYEDAKSHAQEVDQWLELGVIEIENTLKNPEGQQLWAGLPAQTILTPYVEIRTLLSQLKPASGSTFVDLGAGYGRIGFVIGRHYPEVYFKGYELVRKRVLAAQKALERFHYPQVMIEETDLSAESFHPEPAEFYFIYDFGTQSAMQKIFGDLRKIAASRKITVIGRGRGSRDLIERKHPWLSQIVLPEHFPNYSIYRSGAN